MKRIPGPRSVAVATGLLSVVINVNAARFPQARAGANPRNDIAAALSAATKDRKPVLLDFGAEWCIDCRVLWKLLADPMVAPFVTQHFHLVDIDLGEYFVGPDSPKARNLDVATEYGLDPMQEGVPALVLLNPQGKIIPSDHQVKWKHARDFVAPDVLRYLQELALKGTVKLTTLLGSPRAPRLCVKS